MSPVEHLRVPPEQLRWSLDPQELGFADTSEVAACSITPGQNRAVRALELGLALRSSGYNVFVAGDPGTNRSETVRHLLDNFEDSTFSPEDICYVFRFNNPDAPRLLRFPAGDGARFRDAIAVAVERLREGIPRIFQSEVYTKRRRARVKRFSSRLDAASEPLRTKAEAMGLALVQVEIGDLTEAELLPVVEGEPVAFEDLEGMVEGGTFPRNELERLMTLRGGLEPNLRAFRETANGLVSQARKELSDLDRQMTRPFLNVVLSRVYQSFRTIDGVSDYLRETESFLESHIEVFRSEDNGSEEAEEAASQGVIRRLQVNLVLDNSQVTKRPVIWENNPSAANLRGTVDREVLANGLVTSDFTHIKAGSMLRAHGGFLVIQAEDLDSELRAWAVIKRALRTARVEIESESGESPAAARALRPEPIPVDLKVVLIGTSDLYHALLDADNDFVKLFKVKAEFDTEMELGPQAITEFACLARAVCDEDGTVPFSADGVAAIVEEAVRMAGQRNRITTRFTKVADLIRESAFWAQRRRPDRITGEDVHRALMERRSRVNLVEEKTQRLIREGVILIDTEGGAIGQINGLAVLDVGDHRFGRPTRITASVSVGTSGVVNIERMADLSGRYHDKGVLIITGYLQETFATDHPLAISASITLEQSYDEVDGDSASTAEIFSLFSALSGRPARQDLAVTGSMNQKGYVQAVGGVNEKIEGFYDLCAARGLTGTQGVIIPAANLPHLMLRPAVVQAVRERKFHIHAINRVEEGVELILGIEAGARNGDSGFPVTSLFGEVQQRLRTLSDASRDFFPWGAPSVR